MSERQLRPITKDEVDGYPWTPPPPPPTLCTAELIKCITDVLDNVTPTPAPTPPPRNSNNMNMMNMQMNNPNTSIQRLAGNMMIRNGGMMMMMNNANPLNSNANARKLLVRNEGRNARDLNSFDDSDTYSYEDMNEIDDYDSGRRRLQELPLDKYTDNEEEKQKVRSNNYFSSYAISAIGLGSSNYSWSGNVKKVENLLPKDEIHVPDRQIETGSFQNSNYFVFGAEDRFYARSEWVVCVARS